MRASRWGGLVIVALAASACTRWESRPATIEPVLDRPLPTLRVEQMAGREEPVIPPGVTLELDAPRQGERVTLTATDTDLRVLLAALADAAGVDLVVGPDVQGRVTVHFEDVPALEALNRLVVETGYMITAPLRPPWGPTVFYTIPVNVNEADAELIRARFGVSAELARFVVRARIPPS